MSDASRVDVLILTAADGEPEGVQAVTDGLIGSWRKETVNPSGWIGDLWRAEFRTPSGRILRMALARPQAQGPMAAANASGVLVSHYRPSCLAMAGVCAGKPKDTHLGDVVLADRLFRYDGGAQIAEAGGGSHVDHNLSMYSLRADWLKAANELKDTLTGDSASDSLADWIRCRPPSLEWQRRWVLDSLERGDNPLEHPDVKKPKEGMRPVLPDRAKVLERLRDEGLITLGPIELTDAGRRQVAIDRELALKPLDEQPWQLHVAPMSTGEKLIRDPQVWEIVEHLVRSSLALEMEGASVGYSAWAQDVPRCLVAKGVMDNGDPGKTDAYREFAARASAEVLLRFLRENLEPKGRDPSEILYSGIAAIPVTEAPSHLLTARYQTIRFQKEIVGEVWQELETWADQKPGVSVRLFTGPGGAGKTRLLQEFAAHLRTQGWAAGFLTREETTESIAAVIECGRPTFLILDYGESHPLRDEVLRAALTRSAKGPLRIVLLARNAGDWWDRLRATITTGGLLDVPPRALPEIHLEEEARHRFFHWARNDLALALGKELPEDVPDLRHPRFGRPLYLALAAWAQLEGKLTGAGELLSTLLLHEEAFWHRQWPDMNAEEEVRPYMAAVTILGGVSTREDAERLVERLGVSEEVRRLNQLYPGRTAEGRREHTAPLEPDLLGETLAVRVLEDTEIRADYLSRVFQDAAPEVVEHGLIFLGRLEARQQRDPDRVTEWLQTIFAEELSARILPAVGACLTLGEESLPFTLGHALAGALEKDGSVDEAARLESLIPLGSTSLLEVAAWAFRTLLADSDVEPACQASRLCKLGVILSRLRIHAEALSASERAVTSFRSLVNTQRERFLPQLADSLSKLGSIYGEVQRWDDALSAVREAIMIGRELESTSPGVNLPLLAESHNNLGAIYGAMGRWKDAETPVEESVAILRGRVEVEPNTALPHLATSLNNLAGMLRGQEKLEEAIEIAEEAVTIRRQLAAMRPDAFLPDLAISLRNLGVSLRELERLEEALTITNEAVGIQRALAYSQPGTFLPDLAESLSSLSNRLDALGRQEDAIAILLEAILLHRDLAEGNPDRYLCELWRDLQKLGTLFWSLGRLEEAIIPTQEAVDVLRELERRHPKAFRAHIASNLNRLGLWLAQFMRHREALAAVEEAIALRRELVDANGEKFLPDLAVSLMALGTVLAPGDRGRAAIAAREALTICFDLARRDLSISQEQFLATLTQTAEWSTIERDTEAEPIIAAAIQLAVERKWLPAMNADDTT